jgi:hypothetical protein
MKIRSAKRGVPEITAAGDVTAVATGQSFPVQAASGTGDRACGVCGGAAPEGSPMAGPWRLCPDHSDGVTWATVVAELTGVHLTERDVLAASMRMALGGLTLYRERQAVGLGGGANRAPVEPWSHLTPDVREALERDVTALAEQVAAEAAPGTMTPCTLGRCAWCGTERATAWEDHGHRRSDRSPAPLCGTCSPWFIRHGGFPVSWPSQSAGLLAAATGGYSQAGGLMAEVPPHAVRGGGEGTPWSHVDADALRLLRLRCWAALDGKYAPDESSASIARIWARAVRLQHHHTEVSDTMWGTL